MNIPFVPREPRSQQIVENIRERGPESLEPEVSRRSNEALQTTVGRQSEYRDVFNLRKKSRAQFPKPF